MGRLDDYRDEMDALSSEDVEALLSGRVPGGPPAARVATLVADLRDALLEDPAPQVARDHLAVLLAEAEGSGLTGTRRPLRRTRRRVGGLALAAALVIGGGVAAAVTSADDVPGAGARSVPPMAAPAVDATSQEQEAMSLRQEMASDASAHGRAVSAAAQDATVEGCEKGQAVAEVASGKASENRQNSGDRPDPCERGQQGGTGGGNGTGEEASAFGEGIAEDAKAGGRDFGEDKAAQAQTGGVGEQTASQPSGGAGEGGAQGGPPEGMLPSGGSPPGQPPRQGP
jgi:hypothetical protein